MTEPRSRFGWFRRLLPGSSSSEAKVALVCRELVELVTMYLDGSLPAAERARFDAHLAVCPHCTRYLEQFRQTIQASGRLTEEAIAPEAKEALLNAFRGWKASA